MDVNSNEKFLSGGSSPVIIVQSAGHALHVFVNGQLAGMLLEIFFSQALEVQKD